MYSLPIARGTGAKRGEAPEPSLAGAGAPAG
jgi:hypothetical protein